jgi:lipopolysaccharide export system protein LptA
MSQLPRPVTRCLAALGLILATTAAQAQGMSVGFGGLTQNTSAPVEVTADELQVDQAAGAAVFSGNVLVVQGDMRLAAGKVIAEYGDDGTGIRLIRATGGVTLATATEAAEATEATYQVDSGALVMSGGVLLTQGQATIAGDRLTADLRAGTGRMEGRVKTVFQPARSGGN